MTADPMYVIVYLICNFFTIFIIQKFYRIFFEPSQQSKMLVVGAYGLYFLATSLLHLTINIPLLTLFCNLGCYYVITLLYSASLRKRLSAVAFTYIFMFLMEMLVIAGAGVFQFEVFDKAKYVSITVQVVLKLLSFGVAVSASSLRSIKRQKLPAALQFLSSIIVSSASVYLVFTILASETTTQTTALLSIASVLAINVLLFTLYDILAFVYLKNIEVMLWEKEKTYYQHECEMMKTSQEEMAAFRHDIQNHLAILSQMLQHRDCVDVQEYLVNLTDRTKSKCIYSNSGCLPLDSIINYKLRNAEEQGIYANVNVAVPETLNMEIADIVTIMGNLLDNAIQAMLKTNQERNLFLKVIYTKGRLFITVKNTFDGQVVYQNGKIISSKQGAEHGHGLRNVKNALQKYDGSIKLNHDTSFFTVDAMLYIYQT